ncbi:DUF6701 domain-containing protein [Vibrio alginolyticus]|uniref:DUF6701 domain-containing protein n=1 Tax=Vibrio alginolyticus TaxID=663 RepID=UPI00215CFBD7|nr:DUF6701 domain-containing protein [Vibrio alginolyticus]ELB2282611.1 hypothetical protein [Vibrio alginolyticus]MCR9351205.1 hypothetical protein [Vibrio alginolyticus]MCR9363089.1 hypothetical protein [Vibrio alginolyticus]MCR9381902.1 hypothetical protein [Vibrio alginolyticus]MCR9431102.1 hypothetical protein [Vibrio alginolyticus]
MKRIIITALFVSLFSSESFSAVPNDMTPYWSISQGKMKARGSFCGGYYYDFGNYICPNGLTMNVGQSVNAYRDINIHVYGGVELKGKNTLGSSEHSINILSKNSDFKGKNDIEIFGRVESFGAVELKNDIKVHGLIYVSHGKVLLEDSEVQGNVTSYSDGIEIKGKRNVINGSVEGAKDVTLSKVTVNGNVTSTGGQIKTESNGNRIHGDVIAHGDITLKKTVVEGKVTSQGGEVKTESNENEIQGDVWARSKVTLKQTKVTGDVTSEGHEVILESHNQVHGNILALHKVDIKNSLVCGRVESTGSEVSLTNSKLDQNRGVYTLSEAIQSHGKATVKSSTVCGSVNSKSHSYEYNDSDIYCGVDDPNCQPPQTGECPIEAVASLCPELVPVIPPTQQCSLLPEENFNSGSLSNWSVMGFGTSDEPHMSDGRFILNSNKPEQATASAYNYIFPSDQNYLEIEFDHNAYGGNGADGVALVISDASVPPQTGAFGGPLGYGMKLLKNHYPEVSKDVEGFAGGWLGIGIDEFGNYIREGSEKIVSNSVADNVGVRGQGVQDANGKWLKGYPYITGKKYSSSLDNRKGKEKLHRYKVVLNSRNTDTITLAVFRKVGKNGGWDPVIEEFNVLKKGGFNYIPDNFRLSVTASTGMLTNTHDIDNFRVCADKYSRLTDGIHHFEFDYSGSGSTCQASDVTLRACMNESCSEQYPRDAYDDGSLTPLSVTLLPSTGNNVANWVGGTNVQFENETQLELQGSRAGDITLGIDQSSVPQFGFEGARCRINGGPLSANNCNVTFASNVLAVNVNDVVASRETTGEDYLSFCSTRTEDGGESRGVNMSIDYEVAPIDSSQPVVISYKKKVKDQAVEWSSNVELTRANKYLPNVYFDDEGKAFFKLRYSEAGKVKLKASVEGVDDSDGFGSFVSFPSKLKVTAKSGDKSGECTNSKNGCSSGFVAAGEVFELTISALQDDDTVAENYQEKTITVSNKVKYPSNGSLAKLLNEKLPESSKWSRGSVTFDQSVSEVGVFELIAEAPVAKDENGDDIGTSLYLGSNAFKIADGKSTIGRFYPDYFKVTGTEWTYPDNQNQSVYMGQNFESVKFEVTAYNANGYTTQNYGGFANSLKADLYLAGGYSDRLSILDSDLTSDNWSGAVWSKTWDNSVYWRKDLSLPSPDGPFNSKLPADKDSSIETSISLSLNNNGTKVSGYVDPTMFLKEGQNSTEDRMVSQQLLSQPDVRFGRIALDDVGVNQGKSVNIPLRVEYWRDTRFVLNSKDNGTTVSPTLKSQEPVWPDDGSDCDILLEGVRTTVNDGAMRELIAKQERADCGRQQAEVWLNLDPSGNNLPWLKYDWDNDGSEENPSSVVTFGIHRGNDRVIYRGEPGLTGQ